MKFDVVLADPPWQYADAKSDHPHLGGVGYTKMNLEDLCALPVNDITTDDAVLFLWATMPLLEEALHLIRAWGFTYTTCAFNWIKLNPTGDAQELDNRDILLHKGIYSGLGHWVNGNAELCLFARKEGAKASLRRKNKNVKQVMFARRRRHSEKPKEVHTRIESLIHCRHKLELFARVAVPGWICLGNALTNKSIDVELKELIAL